MVWSFSLGIWHSQGPGLVVLSFGLQIWGPQWVQICRAQKAQAEASHSLVTIDHGCRSSPYVSIAEFKDLGSSINVSGNIKNLLASAYRYYVSMVPMITHPTPPWVGGVTLHVAKPPEDIRGRASTILDISEHVGRDGPIFHFQPRFP